jgi:hypothetical protein
VQIFRIKKAFHVLCASALVVYFLLLAGCSCSKDSSGIETCKLACNNTANVGGAVVFSNGMVIAPGADIVLQYSTDSFATVTNTGTVVNNAEGFVAVPYQFPVRYPCNTTAPTIQIRAFQSQSRTDVFVAGDVNGRFDGTDNGNATLFTIPADDAGTATIFLDNVGSQ